MKQPQKLTAKQQRFIQAYAANGGNATQAALTAYNTNYATARIIGHENLTKPNIRREIERLMKNVDLTVEDALRTVKGALDATTDKGNADWPARLKAADMTLKLADAYPGAEQPPVAQPVPQFDFSGEPIAVLHYVRIYGLLPPEEHRRILLEGTPEERRALLRGKQE